MSFILDALRKSENERRLDAAPDIMRAPHAVPRERLPVWAMLALGVLSAALLGVTLYTVLRDYDAGTGALAESRPAAPPAFSTPPLANQPAAEPTAGASQPAAAVPASAPEQTRQDVAGPAPAGVDTGVASSDAADVAPSTAGPGDRRANQPAEASAPAAAAMPVPGAGAAAPPPSASPSAPAGVPAPRPAAGNAALPGYAAAVAQGLVVSPLTMQLHVHSSMPANRFVVINGSRYAEGNSLAEGPRLIEITAEGAILDYRGQRFLLPK